MMLYYLRYAVAFNALLHGRFVRPDIEKIFEFRTDRIEGSR